jgi:hypothetical protein
MSQHVSRGSLNRRGFLKLMGGTALGLAGAAAMPRYLHKVLTPAAIAEAADRAPDLYWAGTDGWIHLPSSPAVGFYFPDDYAPGYPDGLNTYIFGFRNVRDLSDAQRGAQKEHAQHTAPLFWLDQYNPTTGANEFHMQLTNLGLAIRPDLTDSHTIHWHGFRNVIPFYDGEPTTSVSVPVGNNFTYVYRAREPGTYMYHCHVEDVEHVHMGMTGPVFVRPAQNGNTSFYASGKYAYNDGDGSTGYDREFAMLLSEVWAEAHWADSHIQLPEWSDYRADFALINGRVYPDTLAPNGPVDVAKSTHTVWTQRDANGDLIAPVGRPDLQYQPLSALVTSNAGERVLLRFANLGFKETSMTLAGIPMRVIGRDATLMRGRYGADTSYETDTLSFGAGESFDVIFQAPAFQSPRPSPDPGYDRYVLYNRRYSLSNNLANTGGGFGGQRTEVRVYPTGANARPAQQYPNDLAL